VQKPGFVGGLWIVEVDCVHYLLSDSLQNWLYCLPCILYNGMHFNQFLDSKEMQGQSNARSHMT